MELFTTFALLTALLAAVYLYIRRLYTYWERQGVPFVKPTIPYGNLNGIGHEQLALLLDRLYRPLKGQGPIAGIYFLHKPFALVLDINLIKQMVITDFTHFEDRGILYNEKNEPISAHLFAVDAEQWRHLRSKFTPTFTSGKIKFMFPAVIHVADELKKTVTTLVPPGDKGADIEVRDILARYTIDVIGTCAFGIDCNTLKNGDTEFKSMGMKSLDEPPIPPTISLVMAMYPYVSHLLKFRSFAEDVERFFTKTVNDTIEYRQKNDVSRPDFLDLLLKLKSDSGSLDTLTTNEIVAQSFVFFVAGFQTSSTLLLFLLFELAQHPQIQQRLRDDIQAVLCKHNGQLTYEAMKDMHYLEQVINETLRKHPPVGQIRRRVTKQYRIPGTTTTLPVGMNIMVPVYSIHNDPDLFPNPEQFLPERFSKNAKGVSDLFHFMPFGHGPRNCIGSRFAMMEIRLGVISLLMNFQVSPCAKTTKRIEYCEKNVVLVPKGGMWLNLKRL